MNNRHKSREKSLGKTLRHYIFRLVMRIEIRCRKFRDDWVMNMWWSWGKKKK